MARCRSRPVPIRRTPRRRGNPYPYSPTAAESLLQANGWTVNSGGVSTCVDAGHRHRRVRCGHQAGPAGVLQPRIRQRHTDGHPGDEAAGVRLRRWPEFRSSCHADDATTRSSGRRRPARPGRRARGTWRTGTAPGSTRRTTTRPAISSGPAPARGSGAVYAGSNVGGLLRPAGPGGHRGHRNQRLHPGDGRLRGLRGSKHLPVIWIPVQDYAADRDQQGPEGSRSPRPTAGDLPGRLALVLKRSPRRGRHLVAQGEYDAVVPDPIRALVHL